MRDECRISVIIPVYNTAAFIRDALDSVFAQTTPPLEVIVVDDGSTDDLFSVLKEFDGQLHVIHQSRGGPAAALNRGFQEASGTHCARLDADDWWSVEYLSATKELICAQGSDIVITYAQRAVDGSHMGSVLERTVPSDDRFRNILARDFMLGASVISKSLWQRIGGFDETPSIYSAEDYEFWIRAFHAGATASCVNRPVYFYRSRPGQQTSDRERCLRARLSMLEGVFPLCRTQGDIRALRQNLRRTTKTLTIYRFRGRANAGLSRRLVINTILHEHLFLRTRMRLAASLLLPNRFAFRVLP